MTENHSSAKRGLSSTNINLITALLFGVLLIWGPIEPYGLAIRTLYLLGLPAIVWLSLMYFGKFFSMDSATNDRLNRAIVAVIAGACFLGAYNSFTAEQHTVCTNSMMTRDGSECVGDYETVSGNDFSGAFFFSGLGIAASWYAVAARKNQNN